MFGKTDIIQIELYNEAISTREAERKLVNELDWSIERAQQQVTLWEVDMDKYEEACEYDTRPPEDWEPEAKRVYFAIKMAESLGYWSRPN